MQRSESIKEIATALAKFQAEVKNPANSADNPYFKSKYAPLSEILNVTRPLLSKHGLSVLQMPSGDSQETSITTLLMHESGEWIESDPLTMKSAKNDAQGAGSVITYARRYSLSAILGISSEDDDDGNGASGNNSGDSPSKKKTKPADNKNVETPVNEQKPNGNNQQGNAGKVDASKIRTLHVMGEKKGLGHDDLHQLASSKFSVNSLNDMTLPQFQEILADIQKMPMKQQAVGA